MCSPLSGRPRGTSWVGMPSSLLVLGFRTSDPVGNVTTSTYDGDGNLLATTDPLDHTESWTYNSTSR
jgi:YD repeat-containing protein